MIPSGNDHRSIPISLFEQHDEILGGGNHAKSNYGLSTSLPVDRDIVCLSTFLRHTLPCLPSFFSSRYLVHVHNSDDGSNSSSF